MNLVPNSSAEYDSNGDGVANGWGEYYWPAEPPGGLTSSLDSDAYHGDKSQRVQWSGSTSRQGMAISNGGVHWTWLAGETYYYSAWLKTNVAPDALFGVGDFSAVSEWIENPAPDITKWQRWVMRFTIGNSNEIGQSYIASWAAAGDMRIDAVQLELSPLSAYAPSPWRLDILSLDGTIDQVVNASFKSARVTWAQDGSGAVEIGLRDSDVAGGQWLYGRRRLRVRNSNHKPVFQGWLERLERTGSDKLHPEYRAAGLGLAAILDQRVVHGDFSQVAQVATTAAMALLTHIDSQTDDQTGFTLGTVTGTARTVTKYFCDGDVIAALLADLAQDFVWEIDAEGKFNAWVGSRGADLSGTVTLAPDDAIDWSCVGDVAQMATYATGLGDRNEDTPCGPPLVVDFTAERTEYGRREVVIESDTNSESEMEVETTEALRARVASRLSLSTAWIEGRGPWDFGDVWIGDVVNAELGDAFGGDHDMRVVSVTATLEPGVHTFVEMEWEAA